MEESGHWLQLPGMLGACPDGLVGKNVLLEVKCPFTQRDSTIKEAVASGNFYIKKRKMKDTLNLTKNTITGISSGTVTFNWKESLWTTKETLALQIKKDPACADNFCRLLHSSYNPSIHY